MKVPGHLQFEAIQLAPGEEWKGEGGSWLFVRVVGAAYWLASPRSRSLAEGEVLVVGPEAPGSVRASQLNEVVLYRFSFVPAMLYGFFTLAEKQFFEQGLAAAAAEVQFLPSTHPVARRFAEIAARHEADGELVERAELLGLVATFFGERMEQQQTPVKKGILAHQHFQDLVAHMPDLELLNHTPEELAALCGCSPRHFSRLFRQCFGQPPRARQTELRLVKASQLLKSSDERIAQIATACGYRSLSLFNALFKRRFGMNPSQWREQGGEEPAPPPPSPQPGRSTSTFRT
jgi:AraC-like DNA-binding protein